MSIRRSGKSPSDIRNLRFKPQAKSVAPEATHQHVEARVLSGEEKLATQFNPRQELRLIAWSSLPLVVILVILTVAEFRHPWVVQLATRLAHW